MADVTISTDMIQACIDDLVERIRDQLKPDSTFSIVTAEELFQLQNSLAPPLVGVGFNTMVPGPSADKVPERLMVTLKFNIWVVAGQKSFVLYKNELQASGTTLLQLLAAQLIKVTAPTGRPWKFGSQVPVDFGDENGLGYLQEWETVAVLQ